MKILTKKSGRQRQPLAPEKTVSVNAHERNYKEGSPNVGLRDKLKKNSPRCWTASSHGIHGVKTQSRDTLAANRKTQKTLQQERKTLPRP